MGKLRPGGLLGNCFSSMGSLRKRLTERHTQGVARSPLKRLNNGFARLFAAALAFAVL